MTRRWVVPLLFLFLFFHFNDVKGENLRENSSLKTHMEFSYVNITGNTYTDTLSGKLEVRKEKEKNRYFAKGFALYGKNKDRESKQYEETSNKWTVEGRWEMILSPRLFGFLTAHYVDDKFSGYDYRTSGGPGLGYDVIKTEKHYMKGLFSTPYAYDRFEEEKEGETSDSYTLGNIAMDYIWKIMEDLTFKEIADYSFSFEDPDKYFINSETAVEMQMNSHISFGISYLIAYQNTPPSSEVKHADRTFLLSLIIDY